MATSNRYRRHRRLLADINVVPYIDVMLVLLVIFMITAPLLKQGVRVNLPQARSKSLARSDHLPIIVSVDKTGHYYLNSSNTANTPLNTTQLLTQIRQQLKNNQQQTVLVQGDTNARYGKVIAAMSLLQQAGITKLGLITQNRSNRSQAR